MVVELVPFWYYIWNKYIIGFPVVLLDKSWLSHAEINSVMRFLFLRETQRISGVEVEAGEDS